jgi:hypothetical protein
MMDTRRRLTATVAAGSLFLASCAGEDPTEGVDPAAGAEAEQTDDDAAAGTDDTSTDDQRPTDADEPEDEAAAESIGVAVEATPDPLMGVNVTVTPTGFRWAPEHASGEHVDGEGHAHLYVDGEKQGRLYGDHVHLPLEPGEHEIRVTLNGNDHADLVVDGEVIEATTTVEVPERGDSMNGGHVDDGHPTGDLELQVTAEPDAKAGVNVRIETDGFTWAPEHASGAHVDGEGHAHLYVDGEKLGRVYGEWLHLSLDPGSHEIRVTLNGNDHADYLVEGAPVEATVTVEVPEGSMH